MSSVTLQEAQSSLKQLLEHLGPDDEVVITSNDLPIARILPVSERKERKLGTMRGTVLFMAPDFDAPLEDFKEYME